jgi:hypothetical protein
MHAAYEPSASTQPEKLVAAELLITSVSVNICEFEIVLPADYGG